MKVVPVSSEAHWHELRAKNLGGSEVAALFGQSPYTTRYMLWHVKNGTLPPEDLSGNERVLAGQFIEPAVAAWASKKWGINLRKFAGYVLHQTVEGMGCTPDFISTDGSFVVQTKCVDGLEFRRKWTAEGDVITEAPLNILLQVQHELACTGLTTGWLVALVGGNRLLRMIVEARSKTQKKLCAEVAAFWQSIREGREPDPDFTEDGDAIAALLADSEPGKTVDLTTNNRAHALCGEYLHGDELEQQGAALKRSARAELTTLIGSASKAIVGDVIVSMISVKASAGTRITPEMVGQVTGARKAYRRMSVSTQEEGKQK